jgi:hypothetical protein
VPDDPPEADPNPYIPYLASILDAVHHGDPLPSGPDDARASLELATAIYASSITGQPVNVPLGAGHWAYHGIDREMYASRQAVVREAAGAR